GPDGAGDRGHVGEGARAVVHVREDDERGAVGRRGDRVDAERGDRVARHQPQLTAVRGRQPLQHVAVGGEVVGGNDDRAVAGGEGGAGELVEVDGGRVAGER